MLKDTAEPSCSSGRPPTSLGLTWTVWSLGPREQHAEERERGRERFVHIISSKSTCGNVQSSKSAFQMSCDSLQLVLTASHWCSTTAGINEHWIHESTTTVTPKGVGMLCTTYMKQNLVNSEFKTFVNICSFWIWWQRHVSKELGQGQQKTRKVVERSKTASFYYYESETETELEPQSCLRHRKIQSL